MKKTSLDQVGHFWAVLAKISQFGPDLASKKNFNGNNGTVFAVVSTRVYICVCAWVCVCICMGVLDILTYMYDDETRVGF